MEDLPDLPIDNYNIIAEDYEPETPTRYEPTSPTSFSGPPEYPEEDNDDVEMITSTKDLKAQALERGCNFCRGSFTKERKPHTHLSGTEFCYVHKDCAESLFDKIKEGYSWEQNETEIVHTVDNYKCPNCKEVLEGVEELVEEELVEDESNEGKSPEPVDLAEEEEKSEKSEKSKKRKSPEPAEPEEPVGGELIEETDLEKIERLERQLKEAQNKLEGRKKVKARKPIQTEMRNISKLNSARVIYESIVKTLPTLEGTRPNEDFTKFVRAMGKSFFNLAEEYIGEDSFEVDATKFKSGRKIIEYGDVDNFDDWKTEIKRVANENIEAERIRQHNKKKQKTY